MIQSSQCDIIIYDAVNNAPFYSSDAWQIYPVEMVYAVIEVKTQINRTEISKALQACATLRRMCVEEGLPNKVYLRQDNTARTPVQYSSYRTKLPLRFYIFGYRGPKKKRVLRSQFRDLSNKISEAHVHGMCVLDEDTGGLYIQHIAFRKGAAKIGQLEENGLWKFLMMMPQTLSSMLKVTELITNDEQGHSETFCYRPEGFDLVDIDHYPREVYAKPRSPRLRRRKR